MQSWLVVIICSTQNNQILKYAFSVMEKKNSVATIKKEKKIKSATNETVVHCQNLKE